MLLSAFPTSLPTLPLPLECGSEPRPTTKEGGSLKSKKGNWGKRLREGEKQGGDSVSPSLMKVDVVATVPRGYC